MESNEGRYQYTPLRERGAIRIIELQPSPDVEAQVECSLVHTTLYDCDRDTLNHYTALSYVWGDARDTTTILVDGMKLDITTNLYSALRHVRDKGRPYRVWADAVCICQQDLEEKSIQVQQMGEVYRTAQRTVIYLGEATKYSDDVLNYISQRHKQKFGSSSSDVKLSEPSQLNVHDIISRPWFTRVWIFQELLLSRDPWLQSGDTKAPWNFLAKYIVDHPKPSSDRHELQNAYRTFLEMHSSRTEFLKRDVLEEVSWTSVMSNLFDYMIKRGGLGVTNPIDIVYAHLGIAGYSFRGEGRKEFYIDYTKTLKQVFEEVTNYISSTLVGTEAQYDILSYAETSVDFDRRGHDLASWCPDWRTPNSPPGQISIRDAIVCMNQDVPEEGLGVTKRVPPPCYSNMSQGPTNQLFPDGNALIHLVGLNPSVQVSLGRVVGQIMSLSPEISAEQASYQCQDIDKVDRRGRFWINPKTLGSIMDHWDRLFPMKLQYGTRVSSYSDVNEGWRNNLRQYLAAAVLETFSPPRISASTSFYMLRRPSCHFHQYSEVEDLLEYDQEKIVG
ncbi:HET-domain-containing protein [Acephala macrosclerotiorum]|nr:HET-domain-containing protein [Acephala macrosclerotiorum]